MAVDRRCGINIDSDVAAIPLEGRTSTPLDGMVFLEDVMAAFTSAAEGADARRGATPAAGVDS